MLSLRTLGTIAQTLLGELVAPSQCAACDVPVGAAVLLCTACAVSAERAPPTCGESFGEFDDEWLAAFEYGGAIATAIARLKYQGRSDLGPRLGRALLDAASHFARAIDLVVPVPIHPRRLAERGYNQSALLATPVARGLDVHLAPRVLDRSQDTPRQAALDRAERLVNVSGAFSVRTPALVRGAHVLLVDDVRTTGATLAACSAALHGAGAARVRALVLARRA
jgi:ComF family protein